MTEAGDILGIGRSKLYELVAQGEIKVVRIGRRTLIPHDELTRYVASLQSSAAATAETAKAS
jgi:excisionase family DNA binding protein